MNIISGVWLPFGVPARHGPTWCWRWRRPASSRNKCRTMGSSWWGHKKLRSLGMYYSCVNRFKFYNLPLISRKEQSGPLLVVRMTGKSVSGPRTSIPLKDPDTNSSYPLPGPRGISPNDERPLSVTITHERIRNVNKEHICEYGYKNLTKWHLKKQRILTDDEDLVFKRRNTSYLAR